MNLRSEFVMKALGGENIRALCRQYGISSKTGYKWVERFKQEGLAGLSNASRRPRAHARQLAEDVVCEIVRLKKLTPAWGPKKIRAVYARRHTQVPSESTFKRVLDKAGWVERRRTRKRESTGRLYTQRIAEKPNDIWTVDFKGWWYEGERGRCEPLTVRDEFSRYVLEVRAVPNARTETVRACFEKLFERYGLPAAIRSDNGAPFASRNAIFGLTRLSAWWLALGIDLERGRPGCPQDNGAHERFHADIARELQGRVLPERQAIFDTWREEYNDERPHEALGQRCPAEFFVPSPRHYDGSLQDLDYGNMLTRKVHVTGTINWKSDHLQISSALGGWSVGLEPAAGQWKLWFGRLLLGTIDPSAAAFIPITRA